jgi:hypothetical protein
VTPSQLLFRERQWLGPVGWLSILGFAVSLGVAYGAATNTTVGVVTFFVCLAVGTAFISQSATRVHINATEISVGAAHMNVRHIGDAHVIDAERVAQLRRERVSSQGWWAVPAWMTRAVVFTVVDDSDPHAFWVIGTRRPEQLLHAIGQARDTMRPLSHD